MWLIVAILASGGMASALWLVGAVVAQFIGRARGSAGGWISGNMRHAGAVVIACAACATAVHLGMTHIDALPNQMPAALLRLDVGRPWYGRIALHSFVDRAVQNTLSLESASSVTDTLLESDWWLEETRRQTFDASREPERWLTTQMGQARLTDQQLAKWLNLVPPPMFLANADTRESPSSIKLTAVFGREWKLIDQVPYRVDRLQIAEIRVNGEAQEFSMEQGANSEAERGWEAHYVEYLILGLHAPATDSPRCEIEVIYRLDLEPGSYRNIGPLSWKTALLVN